MSTDLKNGWRSYVKSIFFIFLGAGDKKYTKKRKGTEKPSPSQANGYSPVQCGPGSRKVRLGSSRKVRVSQARPSSALDLGTAYRQGMPKKKACHIQDMELAGDPMARPGHALPALARVLRSIWNIKAGADAGSCASVPPRQLRHVGADSPPARAAVPWISVFLHMRSDVPCFPMVSPPFLSQCQICRSRQL